MGAGSSPADFSPPVQGVKDDRTQSYGVVARSLMVALVAFSATAVIREFIELPGFDTVGYGWALVSLIDSLVWILITAAVIHNGKRMRILGWLCLLAQLVTMIVLAVIGHGDQGLLSAHLLTKWGASYYFIPLILTVLSLAWLAWSSPYLRKR